MRQQKISAWLKGLVIVLGVMGIAFFGGLSFFAFQMKSQEQGMLWSFIFFSWYTAALCYGVLFQFWKVCSEIGKDNSFSKENADSFHKMALLGGASGAGYLVRMIYLIVVGTVNVWVIGYSVFLMLLSGVFVILCEALSKLIQNAYEVKLENELTI